jgi:hypothetical protein
MRETMSRRGLLGLLGGSAVAALPAVAQARREGLCTIALGGREVVVDTADFTVGPEGSTVLALVPGDGGGIKVVQAFPPWDEFMPYGERCARIQGPERRHGGWLLTGDRTIHVIGRVVG